MDGWDRGRSGLGSGREAHDEAMVGGHGRPSRSWRQRAPREAGTTTPSAIDTDASASHEPVTIEMWSAWTSKAELEDFDKIFASFEEAYPWITVKSVGNVDDTKMLAAINSGTPPDAVLSFSFDNVGKFCAERARGRTSRRTWSRPDFDASQFPASVDRVHELRREHVRVAIPDGRVRALLQHRHVRGGQHHRAAEDHVASWSRPRRSSPCSTTTARSRSPGSCPTWRTTRPTSSRSPRCSTPSGTTTTARSRGRTPTRRGRTWPNWQKELVDFYGYDNLQRFVAGQGDEWGEENDFQTGPRRHDDRRRVAHVARTSWATRPRCRT